MPFTDDASGDTGDRRSCFGCAASAAVQPSLNVKTARSWRGIVATHLAREGCMTVTIGRRELLAALGGAVAWPLAAWAQQPAMPVVGFLNPGSPIEWAHLVAAFKDGLAETGYVESQNVAIEYRWGGDRYDRLPEMAADLVRRQVAVIVTAGGPGTALAAKAATSAIPIVFNSGTDPVEAGLVRNVSRPDGNLTGVHLLTTLLSAKRQELLHELLPSAGTVAMLVNPSNAQNRF